MPIVIHGDDCDAHRRRSFCVCTLSSALCGGSPFDSKILLYATDNSRSCTETFDTLDTWLVWSLIELQEGRYMTVDPWQNPINRPDEPIAGPYRAVLVNLKGDEKWMQKVLKLKTSWVSHHICPVCRASKSDALIYTSFGKSAPHRATCLNTRQFIEEACRPGAWIRLPGFHISLVTFDWLHIVDLAIIPECAASVTGHEWPKYLLGCVFEKNKVKPRNDPTKCMWCIIIPSLGWGTDWADGAWYHLAGLQPWWPTS